jgi:hypothetical protein
MPLLEGQPLNVWLKIHPRSALTTVLRWGRDRRHCPALAQTLVHGLEHQTHRAGTEQAVSIDPV